MNKMTHVIPVLLWLVAIVGGTVGSVVLEGDIRSAL